MTRKTSNPVYDVPQLSVHFLLSQLHFTPCALATASFDTFGSLLRVEGDSRGHARIL